jgi:hypothetical protein
MRGETLIRLVLVIAALHLAILCFVFGLRQFGYILAATLSATLIWGAVFLMDARKRRVGLIVGGKSAP